MVCDITGHVVHRLFEIHLVPQLLLQVFDFMHDAVAPLLVVGLQLL